MVPPCSILRSSLMRMSAPSAALRYSLTAASMPWTSWPSGVSSMFSVAEMRVTLALRSSIMVTASSKRLRLRRESL